jgi:hypothetical protein
MAKPIVAKLAPTVIQMDKAAVIQAVIATPLRSSQKLND